MFRLIKKMFMGLLISTVNASYKVHVVKQSEM